MNVLKADADVLKADPRCDHHFSVVVDLQQPVISHRVVKPDEESAIDDGISGAVYACYIERERARQERERLEREAEEIRQRERERERTARYGGGGGRCEYLPSHNNRRH